MRSINELGMRDRTQRQREALEIIVIVFAFESAWEGRLARSLRPLHPTPKEALADRRRRSATTAAWRRPDLRRDIAP